MRAATYAKKIKRMASKLVVPDEKPLDYTKVYIPTKKPKPIKETKL